MQGLGWQDLAAGALAVAALAWLVRRRLVRRARLTPFCEDCPGCGPARTHGASQVSPPGPARDDLIPISRITGRRG
jgi:hypothetical protein